MSLLVQNDFDDMKNVEKATSICQKLMATKHFMKLGEIGVFTIVAKAMSMNYNVLDAVNGGMYYVNGKVELSAAAMNQLIRRAGHSVTMDSKSDATKCILYGKRADNGDTMIASFSVEEAKQAGIYKGAWLSYTSDMLFARALSRLARRLFADVIKGCYVEGEIACLNEQEPPKNVIPQQPQIENKTVVMPEIITQTQYDVLNDLIGEDKSYRQKLTTWLKDKHKIDDLRNLKPSLYESALKSAQKNFEEKNTIEVSACAQ